MTTVFPFIMLFSLLSGAGSLALAGSVLVFPQRARKILVPALISYATGTLLAAAFIGLLPEAAKAISVTDVLKTALIGILAFFALEKLVLWRHCHAPDCNVHSAAGPLILIGDGLHNFIDGIVLAAAFTQSVPLGIATSLAVIAHELPQEAGDFAILLEGGYSRRRAFAFNLASSLATVVGAVLGYVFLTGFAAAIPYFMAVAAASFIYVAVADLFPSLHTNPSPRTGLVQLGLMGLGIATIAAI